MRLSAPALTETTFGRFPSIFARIHGKKGKVREYKALINPLSEYCIIPKVDAYLLGYPEVAFQHPTVAPPNSRTLLTYDGYNRSVVFTIGSVDVGSLHFEEVEFAAFDLPQASGFEAVIGKSLMERTTVTLDWSHRKLTLLKVK